MAKQKPTLLKRLTLASLLLLGGYLIWCTIVWNRKPTIAVDYVALATSRASSVLDEDAAYPLYLDAAIALKDDGEPGAKDPDIILPEWPYHDGWEPYTQWLQRQSETLELIREAGHKTGLGYVPGSKPTERQRLLYGNEWVQSFIPEEEFLEGSLLGITLPALSTFRELARTLRFDARQAAFEGDQSRFVSDVEGILNIAHHVRETPFIINDLVALSIEAMANGVTGETLALSPDIFDTEHLTLLMELFQDSDDLYDIRTEIERLITLDLLQRMYTDDGNGNGSLIMQTLPIMDVVTSVTTGDSLPPIHPVFAFLSAPIISWNIASRQEMLGEYDRQEDYYIEQSNRPLYARELNDAKRKTPRLRFLLIDLMKPNYKFLMDTETYSLARRDAVVAAIAMEVYRRENGQWPTALAQAMVEPPIDPWSGEPMQIAFEDGRPLIYSIGVDRNDDGGDLHNKTEYSLRSPWAAYLEPERMLWLDGDSYSASDANLRAMNWQPADADDLPDGDWILWPPIVD